MNDNLTKYEAILKHMRKHFECQDIRSVFLISAAYTCSLGCQSGDDKETFLEVMDQIYDIVKVEVDAMAFYAPKEEKEEDEGQLDMFHDENPYHKPEPKEETQLYKTEVITAMGVLPHSMPEIFDITW